MKAQLFRFMILWEIMQVHFKGLGNAQNPVAIMRRQHNNAGNDYQIQGTSLLKLILSITLQPVRNLEVRLITITTVSLAIQLMKTERIMPIQILSQNNLDITAAGHGPIPCVMGIITKNIQ